MSLFAQVLRREIRLEGKSRKFPKNRLRIHRRLLVCWLLGRGHPSRTGRPLVKGRSSRPFFTLIASGRKLCQQSLLRKRQPESVEAGCLR
jgi:hypothetical protein